MRALLRGDGRERARRDAAAGGGFELNVSVITRRRAFLFRIRILCIFIITR